MENTNIPIKYDETFKLGDATEMHFAQMIMATRGYESAKITQGKFTDYDIIGRKMRFSPEDPIETTTFEIKTSAGESKCNTHFVEVKQNLVDSGLAISNSDWYVFYSDSGIIYAIKTKRLKEIVEGKRLIHTKHVKNGIPSGSGYIVHSSQLQIIGNHDLDLKRKS